MSKLDKVWPAVALAVEQAVEQVLCAGRQSEDLAVSMPRQYPKWGSRDRKFFAGSLFDILRYWVRYARLAGGDPGRPEHDLIRKALYLLWLNQGKDISALPPLPEMPVVDEATLSDAERAGFPQSLWQRLQTDCADLPDDLMMVFNQPAAFCLRVNSLKCSVRKMEEILRAENIAYSLIADTPGAIVLTAHQNLRDREWMQNGWVEVQDVSSQQLGHFIQPREGSRILDACAGTGGKSLHLASLTSNRASIFASDVYPAKLDILERRAKRAGASSIRRYNAADMPGILFDTILIDAPCSGSGTLRRKAEAKWRLTDAVIEEKIITQRNIVKAQLARLAPGGEIIYATCSIFQSENQHQVACFQQEYGLSLQEEKVISPLTGFDGFYMARLSRKAE